MQLILLEKTYDYPNKVESIDELIQQIIDTLNESNLYFNYLIVDGVEVYDECEEYLLDRINDIKKIEVEAKTVETFTSDLLLMGENYLKGAIPEVSKLADEFYKGATQNTWEKFQQLLEGLQWLYQFIETVNKNSERPYNWDQFLEISGNLQNELQNLNEALVNNDAILIGDLISYEIQPLLERFKDELTNTIDHQGQRTDLN
ncbi:MAG TPA: hypothetical protein GX497_13365 [Bacillus bacterium]|nr:hypothetical protein [Bacillus sp. (in: firmicutes)]